MTDRRQEPDQKEELVRQEQETRGFRETHGRPAGERFSGHDFPRSYSVPQDLDWRRALRAYITGHDRNWEADRKFEEAAEETAPREETSPEAAPREETSPEAAPREEPPPEAGPREETSPGTAPGGRREDAEAGETEKATGRTGETPRVGVGVPDRDDLEFHRGASIWRDELPESRRMPRHTDRSLDGRRGRGEQA